MKQLLLAISIIFSSHVYSQNLVYSEKGIYDDDTLIFNVIEINKGRVLEEHDYFDNDSSQYYDYLIVDTNDREILYLKAFNIKRKSDGHYPDRYAAHYVSPRDGLGAIQLGIVSEENLSILSDSATYREYLIMYFIDYGLLTKEGLDRDLLSYFRFQHRE